MKGNQPPEKEMWHQNGEDAILLKKFKPPQPFFFFLPVHPIFEWVIATTVLGVRGMGKLIVSLLNQSSMIFKTLVKLFCLNTFTSS